MPAIASLSLNDSVPAAHTFAPVTTDGTTAKWADRSPTIPAGFRTISLEVSPPSGNRTTHKIGGSFYLPVVASINGVDQVVRYNSGTFTLNIHPDALLVERKDLRAYLANFIANASVITAVENIEPFY